MNENTIKLFNIALSVTLLLISFVVFTNINSSTNKLYRETTKEMKLSNELSRISTEKINSSNLENRMITADIFLKNARSEISEQFIKINERKITLNPLYKKLSISMGESENLLDNSDLLKIMSNKTGYELKLEYDNRGNIIKVKFYEER